ncbi:MAG: T9SS type A sorting domain-containing protein [Crocinitomicaceae bacterium]|nr:T9SS type A sorting domain-containing protein [Crocinitomicaceae bacterium]
MFTSSTPIAGATHVSGNLFRFDGVAVGDANYFTLGTINPVVTPLPITLLDFTAEKKVRNVVLNWSTASEQNNDRFEIERTTDGINWITIQTLSGNGNSNTVINYTGTDRNPINGTNYYRLKQIDFNGEHTFSNVRSVVFTAPTELNVFPNPAKNIVTINRGADAVIQIINELGQIMHADQEISGNSTTFNLSGLNSGVYFVKVQDEDSIYNRKIIILQD